MSEQLLKEALSADCREAGDPAMQTRLVRLQPEIARAAARLKARREARRQNLMFCACACAFAAAAGFAALDWSRGGTAFREILMGGGALMGLILALSPLMAYWLEREREHEKA
jgi:hypothetical protein